MPWILSIIIHSKVLAKEVLFLRKSKAEFDLTNLKLLVLRLSYLSKLKYCNYE